mgnify:CR=1 FL=1
MFLIPDFTICMVSEEWAKIPTPNIAESFLISFGL